MDASAAARRRAVSMGGMNFDMTTGLGDPTLSTAGMNGDSGSNFPPTLPTNTGLGKAAFSGLGKGIPSSTNIDMASSSSTSAFLDGSIGIGVASSVAPGAGGGLGASSALGAPSALGVSGGMRGLNRVLSAPSGIGSAAASSMTALRPSSVVLPDVPTNLPSPSAADILSHASDEDLFPTQVPPRISVTPGGGHAGVGSNMPGNSPVSTTGYTPTTSDNVMSASLRNAHDMLHLDSMQMGLS